MNISIEHILLFLIVVFLFYHFLGNCGCVKEINGFSVGGQSASSTCKCKYTDCFYPLKRENLPQARCSNAKNASECTCDYSIYDRLPPGSECHSGMSGRRQDACTWDTCNSITYGDDGNTYTFDLTPLNLDPSKYIIGYRYTIGIGWSITKTRHDGGVMINNGINQEQLSILDCLYNQAKIFFIGVSNDLCIYEPLKDYIVYCGSLKESDLKFYDDTGDDYSLNISSSEPNTHQTCYSSTKPILKNLTVVQTY
jgi:hypothetical protein